MTTTPNYKKFQYVPLVIRTHPTSLTCLQLIIPEEGETSEITKKLVLSYQGLQNQNEDFTKRIATLKNVLLGTKNFVDPNPEVLKIFSTPEFFFRPASGAYDSDVQEKGMEEIDKMLAELSGADNKAFNHWIFFFGSIISRGKNNEDGTAAYNNIIYVKNGNNLELSHKIVKKHTSPLDFVTTESKSVDHTKLTTRKFGGFVIPKEEIQFVPNSIISKCYYDSEGDLVAPSYVTKEEIDKENASTAIMKYEDMVRKQQVSLINPESNCLPFGMEGFMFGVEVGLDHQHKAMREHLSRTRFLVDFHIFISCGLPPIAGSVAAKKGGYFLTNDGHPATARFKSITHKVDVTALCQKINDDFDFTADAPLSEVKQFTAVDCPNVWFTDLFDVTLCTGFVFVYHVQEIKTDHF